MPARGWHLNRSKTFAAFPVQTAVSAMCGGAGFFAIITPHTEVGIDNENIVSIRKAFLQRKIKKTSGILTDVTECILGPPFLGNLLQFLNFLGVVL